MYNASGRGFPDISAQSHNFRVVVGGTVKGISGTSAAAPVVAGIVSAAIFTPLSQYTISVILFRLHY